MEIKSPPQYFGLPDAEAVTAYLRQATHVLWSPRGRVFGETSEKVAVSPFLDPDAERYIVISVSRPIDTVGGAALIPPGEASSPMRCLWCSLPRENSMAC